MAEPTASRDSLTVEEYMKLEESATVRHEYVAGEIHAMIGATRRHNRIAGNITLRSWAPPEAVTVGSTWRPQSSGLPRTPSTTLT